MSAPKDAFRPKARRPRGFMDRRAGHLGAERALIGSISKVYEAWGFEPLETSAFEYADALGKFLPDQDRPNEGVFALQDDDEQWVSLRYDLTAPLARFVAENFDALPKPYRRWAAGPVWRNEKPGPGRFREFWQCDADTVGAPGPAADAEMIAMACAALESAGVARGDYKLKVSDRRIVDGALEWTLAQSGMDPSDASQSVRMRVLRAIDKWDRLGNEGVRLLLCGGRKDESGDFTPGAGLSERAAQGLLDVLANTAASNSAWSNKPNSSIIQFLRHNFGDHPQQYPSKAATLTAINDLETISRVLESLGVEDRQWQIDTSVVRGLEYYTGPVFEAELMLEMTDERGEKVRFGSVGGGGRYDDLVSRFRGEAIPATGFSIGVSRLAAALDAAKRSNAGEVGPVVVLVMDKARVADSFAIADDLRKAGVRAEVYLGGGGMKAQLKYADKRNAPVAVIEGEDEKNKGVVTLKNLALGAEQAKLAGDDREAWKGAQDKVQIEAPRGDIVAAVKAMLTT